ncbi:MAG: hypothetical protein GX444_02975 [Myxococcales bacterium]|nr:hypothetical protein [Myxococcales bacterium]
MSKYIALSDCPTAIGLSIVAGAVFGLGLTLIVLGVLAVAKRGSFDGDRLRRIGIRVFLTTVFAAPAVTLLIGVGLPWLSGLIGFWGARIGLIGLLGGLAFALWRYKRKAMIHVWIGAGILTCLMIAVAAWQS